MNDDLKQVTRVGINANEKRTVFCLPEKAPSDSSRSEHARGIDTTRGLSPGVRGTALRKSQGPGGWCPWHPSCVPVTWKAELAVLTRCLVQCTRVCS